MRFALGLPLLPVLALALCVRPASCQEVQGTLRSENRGLPIVGARLYLVPLSGAAVDTTLSDGDGAFRLAAPAAGDYTIHFQMDGFAEIASDEVALTDGTVTAFSFVVPLLSTESMRRMGEMIRNEERLQTELPALCGEAVRNRDTGMLVGTVRARATEEPVVGARVTVSGSAAGSVRPAVSSERGVFVLCNVPLGDSVAVVTEPPGLAPDTTRVEIRAGMVSWFDLYVGPGPG